MVRLWGASKYRIRYYRRTLKFKRLSKMQNDEIVTIPLPIEKCTNCPGVVFNIVTIDGVRFTRCIHCGTFRVIKIGQF